MDRRTVLQWDKDACESMGLVKFDLLGLGMLGALDHMMRLVADHLGEQWDLATMPKEEPAVYDMLCRADSIGVFQVESRAQIGTLPRLRPREFYDLAIEIALIRPGPIQGGAVHPYVRRATGQEPVTYDHPELVPVLERTKGVPLFQEQLMAMAVTLGDCSRDDADLLRRAMGSKRGVERIESVKQKLYAGMARRGITGDLADSIYVKILSFANFGFAESHALSFALLVYASSWFKLHYPAAFLAGLLRNQPMGFYSPQSLVGDARRHGVDVRRPDVTRSAAQADLEPVVPARSPPPGPTSAAGPRFERVEWVPGTPDPVPAHRRDGALAVRLGLDSVRGIGLDVARRIVAARDEAPFTGITDLSRRAGLTSAQLEALATAGAFDAWGLDRREALWAAGFAEGAEHLPGITPAPAAPTLPGHERAGDHPGRPLGHRHLARAAPDRAPARRAAPRRRPLGRRARRPPSPAGGSTSAGSSPTGSDRAPRWASPSSTSRTRPGMLNVVCSIGVMKAHRQAARNRVAVVIRGRSSATRASPTSSPTGSRASTSSCPAPARCSRRGRRRATSGDRWVPAGFRAVGAAPRAGGQQPRQHVRPRVPVVDRRIRQAPADGERAPRLGEGEVHRQVVTEHRVGPAGRGVGHVRPDPLLVQVTLGEHRRHGQQLNAEDGRRFGTEPGRPFTLASPVEGDERVVVARGEVLRLQPVGPRRGGLQAQLPRGLAGSAGLPSASAHSASPVQAVIASELDSWLLPSANGERAGGPRVAGVRRRTRAVREASPLPPWERCRPPRRSITGA